MFKTWFIIILLFLGAVIGVLGWFVDFEPYYSFKSSAKVARATPVANSQKPGRAITRFDEARFEYPLRFKTEAGRDVVAIAHAPRSALDKIEQDGHVNVLYLPDEPERVLFEGDIPRMPKGYLSLLLGLASLVIGIAAVKARYSLARHARHLGRGGSEGDGD